MPVPFNGEMSWQPELLVHSEIAERLAVTQKQRAPSTCPTSGWCLLLQSLLGTSLLLICPCCMCMVRNLISRYFTATISPDSLSRLLHMARTGLCTQHNAQTQPEPGHTKFCLSIAGLTTGKRVLLKRNWLLASVAVCTAEGVTVLTFNPHTWLLHAVVLVKLGYVPASLLLLCLPLDRIKGTNMETILETSGGSRDAKWIFVLSTSRNLYVDQKLCRWLLWLLVAIYMEFIFFARCEETFMAFLRLLVLARTLLTHMLGQKPSWRFFMVSAYLKFVLQKYYLLNKDMAVNICNICHCNTFS